MLRVLRLLRLLGRIDGANVLYVAGLAAAGVTVWLLWPVLLGAYVGASLLALGLLVDLGRAARRHERR